MPQTHTAESETAKLETSRFLRQSPTLDNHLMQV